VFFLILTGVLSGLFFSSTFILNRLMSLGGGHWLWSASLRYVFMFFMLIAVIALFQGRKVPLAVCRLYLKNWRFWSLAGSIGFGGFYSLICFSADYTPGWVIASTWQLTIIASLIVLMGFGRSFPRKIWAFSFIILAGVLLVNTSQIESLNTSQLLLGGLPVLLAAFCYPIGNQLVWEAKTGRGRLPKIDSPYLDNAFNKVFLMTLGSIPFWIILLISVRPPPPSNGQILNTALVALFSGILATSLFLFARSKAKKPSELAAVDATQSSEVIFAMAGEVAILGAPLPGPTAIAGITLVFLGLIFFIKFQEQG
jgi:drug/metabolite transporter (DMT)-like permease